MRLTFLITPVPKGRPRTVRNKQSGKVITFTPDATVEAELKIQHLLMSWMKKKGYKPPLFFPDANLQVELWFYLPVPKGVEKSRTYREGRSYPNKRPDLDNYEKLVMDAAKGILYKDDGQIVSQSGHKRYKEMGKLPCIIIDIKVL